MSRTPITKLVGVGTACAALGAGGGAIATAGATGHHAATPKTAHAKRMATRGQARRVLRRVVHADLVLARRNGSFATATVDRGIVRSVSGDQLTLAVGTRKATYKTITFTIPATAAVRDDGRTAQLSDVKAGQRAFVYQGPSRTVVRARDVR